MARFAAHCEEKRGGRSTTPRNGAELRVRERTRLHCSTTLFKVSPEPGLYFPPNQSDGKTHERWKEG